MDIRKVQSIVKDIYAGASDDSDSIKVSITDDIDSLNNGDKILVIGSAKNTTYQHRTASSFATEYFKIIDESNHQLVKIIDDMNIPSPQWFPVCAFITIFPEMSKKEDLKAQQIKKIGKRAGNYTLIFTFQGKTDSTSPGFVHK